MKRESATVVCAGTEVVPEGGERETTPFATHAADGTARTVREGDVLGGKYQVDRVLRAGGMGVVLVATHLQLKQKVALKVLVGHAANEPANVARFLREARSATLVNNEHVVRILDFGTLDEGEPFLVMELLQGRDLRDVLYESGRLPVDLAVRYMLQVCRGLSAVHAQRIIHRDLKPANLFLTQTSDGTPLVKVLDFGIAKALEPERLLLDAGERVDTLTGTSQLLGSPVYMSPEQIRCSTKVDERSDIWSLGIILYELLTGEPPFNGSTVSGLLVSIAADEPIGLRTALPSAPAELAAVIAACLQKDVERRPRSVEELASRLTKISALVSGERYSVPTDVEADGAPSRPSSRTRWMVTLAAALVTFAAMIVLFRARNVTGASTTASPSTERAEPTQAREEPTGAPPTAATVPTPPSIVDEPVVASAAADATSNRRPHPPARPAARQPASQPSARVAPIPDYETSATDRRK